MRSAVANDSAWTKIYHDDFLQGCRAANLNAEEIGVYAVVLFLIASRGSPIEDDRRWIAGFTGLSTRKASQIIDKLAALPNKLVVRNGMIGNHKMLRVVRERDRKSDQARRAAHARWHGDDPKLPLEEPETPIYPREKPKDKSEITSEIKSPKRQKSAIPDDADASRLARARDSETQNPIPSHPKDSVGKARANGGTGETGLRDKGLIAQYEAIAHAAGLSTTSPAAIDRAITQVERWIADGIDVEQTILPVVREVTAKSDEPTRLLSRFDKAVRFAHAKRSAGGDVKRAPVPEPILSRKDEPDEAHQFRAELLKRLGAPAYVRFANKVRIELIPERRVLRINDPRIPYLLDEHRALAREVAKLCGMKDVW